MALLNAIKVGLIGVGIGVVIDEIMAVPQRVEKAENRGYQTGYQVRDRELEPIVSDLENRVNNYSSRVSSLENTVAEKERLIQELKEKLDSIDTGS